jgi:hypothetical protein
LAEDTPAALMARTGRCLELECLPPAALQIDQALRNHVGVLRVETADFGVRAYLTSMVSPEDIVHKMHGICPLEGFRTRSPDLAEVFRSLTAESANS